MTNPNAEDALRRLNEAQESAWKLLHGSERTGATIALALVGIGRAILSLKWGANDAWPTCPKCKQEVVGKDFATNLECAEWEITGVCGPCQRKESK